MGGLNSVIVRGSCGYGGNERSLLPADLPAISSLQSLITVHYSLLTAH